MQNNSILVIKKGTREMNALELADWIANGAPFGKYETAKQAVVMLRQQQAEIKKLKAEVVSYRTDAEKLTMRLIDIAVSVPVKKLTDEEIWEFIPMRKNDIFVEAEAEDFILFARAILRKAQEK